METLIKLFPFFTPDSHYATKPYLYGCLCSNYAFLCIIRASAEPVWILGFVNPSDNGNSPFTVSVGDTNHIITLAFAGICAISIQACLITRRLGYKIQAVTLIASVICTIQACLAVTLIVQFANQYPFHIYRYSTGGYSALFSGSLATVLSLLFFLADVSYFSSISKENSLEQKKFEFANILFILYILFGAGWFCFLESWGFERAAEFCLMTVLTIGYGNVVPTSFWGRFFMICYTSIGLCVAGFFIISVEDVIIQDAEASLLRKNESLQVFQDSLGDSFPMDHPLDPDLIYELLPIPLSQTMTNTSIMSRNSVMSRDSDYPLASAYPRWTKVLEAVRVVMWVLGWWLGAGAVFAYFEGWPYFNGVYFAFVSMTGIGYGDLTIHSPPAVEAWWIFLFNAISIIAFFISLSGKSIAEKVATEQMKIHRKRLVRQLKRKRIRIRNTGDVAILPHSMTTMSASQFFSQAFSEQEMNELNQNSIGRRLGHLGPMKGHSLSLPRNISGSRLQNMFIPPPSTTVYTVDPTLVPLKSSTQNNGGNADSSENGNLRKPSLSPNGRASFTVEDPKSTSVIVLASNDVYNRRDVEDLDVIELEPLALRRDDES